MADNSKDGFEGWPEDENSGFYGEPDDWFSIPSDAGLTENSTADALPDDLPEETEQIRTYHKNEPEEELADWNTPQESTYTEYDPFFDPDLPNIERPGQKTQEAPEKPEKPKKKKFSFGKKKAVDDGSFLDEEEEPENVPVPEPAPEPKPKKRPVSKVSRGTYNKKLLLYIAAGAACAVAIFFIVYAALNTDRKKPEAEETAEPEVVIATENASVTEIRHLSFPRLSAFEAEGLLSVNEFSQILGNLYENGYVLVDPYAIAERGKDGNFTLDTSVEVPEGKKPLILSQRDVPEVSAYDPGTFSDGLMIGEDGELRSQYTDADGNTAMGDLDVVPILESFLREHPDFSFAGARGIAAVTGYDGLIGKTGTDAADVISLMKDRGWRFASNGYKGISYGSELTLIEEDANAWAEQVKSRVGDTDLIILPRGTDIASWAPYTRENPKYELLYGLGFRYYFVDTPDTPGLLQVESEYVREAIIEIDTYGDYQNALDSGAL